MKKWGTKIAVNFLVRGIVSFAIIFFVNGFLDGQGISACVGMNPVTFLTSGILGFPGVAISEQEMGSSIMRETDNLWMPVKRFLNKHKKSKWGDWDGLHIEEEEL